jgi:hypothetical protein
LSFAPVRKRSRTRPPGNSNGGTGFQALFHTTGVWNNVFCYQALFFNTTGDFNSSIVFSAKGAAITWSLGQRPRDSWNRQTSPLKARFTSGSASIIFRVMPQSLSKVILHIIFSTKNREPSFDPDVRPRMHPYLATLCRDLGAELVRVCGVADHVHIVTTLPRTVSQAQFVEQIKKASSKCHLPTH